MKKPDHSKDQNNCGSLAREMELMERVLQQSPEPYFQKTEGLELPGGSMIKVLRYCALKKIQSGSEQFTQSDILRGIRKEFQK